MPDEIEQAISLIDQKIASLKKLRDQLADEFGRGAVIVKPLTEVRMPSNGQRWLSRKAQVEHFLKEHGPSTRSEIIHGTGIPVGTVSYALNDQEMFVSREGKWCAKEPSATV